MATRDYQRRLTFALLVCRLLSAACIAAMISRPKQSLSADGDDSKRIKTDTYNMTLNIEKQNSVNEGIIHSSNQKNIAEDICEVVKNMCKLARGKWWTVATPTADS